MQWVQWTILTLLLACQQQARPVSANTGSLTNAHVLNKSGTAIGGVPRGYHSKKRIKERSNVSTTTAKYSVGAGEFVPEDIAAAVAARNPNLNNKAEPTCEQLRAMWRLSKRHSRAAEVTNEIPHYSDPFAHGINSYARQMITRSSPSSGEPTYAVMSSSPAASAVTARRSPRPVVYGKVRHAPDADLGTGLRPFDTLRVVASQSRGSGLMGSSKSKLSASSSDSPAMGVISNSPADTFRGQAVAKNTFNHLREIVQAEKSREQAEWNRARVAVENALEAREMAAVAAQEAVRSPYAFGSSHEAGEDLGSSSTQITRPFEKLRYGRLQIPSQMRSESGSTKSELLKAASILKELEEDADSGIWSGPKALRAGKPLLDEPTTSMQEDENWYDGGMEQDNKQENLDSGRDREYECVQLLAGAPCRTNADCLCANSGPESRSRRRSRCHRGSCQLQPRVQYAAYDDYGLWHTEPIPSEQLGAWTRRRRTAASERGDDR